MVVTTRSNKRSNIDSNANTSKDYDDTRRKRTKVTKKTKNTSNKSHCLHSKRSQHRSQLQTPTKKNVSHSKSNDSPFGILHDRLIVNKDIVPGNEKEVWGSLSDSESNTDVSPQRSFLRLKKGNNTLMNFRKDEESFSFKGSCNSNCFEYDDSKEHRTFTSNDGSNIDNYESLFNENEGESFDENNDNTSVSNDNDNSVEKCTTTTKGFQFPLNAIIIPRKHNKKQDIMNTNYITTNDNRLLYSKIVCQWASIEYYRSHNKKKFIIDFIDAKFDGYEVYKYNTKRNVYCAIDHKELNVVLKQRFTTLKASYYKSRRTAKKYKNMDNLDVDPYLSKNVHRSKKAYNDINHKRSSSYIHFYRNENVLRDYNNWHFYSMFHSVYQSFSTVVYNYSHRLANKSTVHRNTRLKLLFPENANCILVIHGRLVHSGSASKLETSNSFNTSHDLRLFAYLSTLSSRQDRNKLYKDHLPSDTVDVNTFKMCDKNCPKCSLVNDNGLIGLYDNDTLDIGEYLKKMESSNCNNSTKRTQKNPVKVVGDLNELGWAVYTGIDLNLVKYTNLHRQLRVAVIGKGKDSWYGINSTMRKVLKIDRLLGEDNRMLSNDMPLLTEVFDDILHKILKQNNVIGQDVQMDGRAVLANFDYLEEQRPHRDFSSEKR